MKDQELVEQLKDIAGVEAIEPGGPSAMLGTVEPRVVVAPHDVDAVCRVLAWADHRRLCVAPVGSGTKFDWGQIPPVIDIALSTRHLNSVIDHRHADLTVTVQAGARLDTVNQELGVRSQWVALDPSWSDRATIGGILATNDSGPRRHRHGAPRDLLIGVTFVTADGTLAHSGGRVVKNVAGYDLGKLLVGSHGSLGVIVEATFKLMPRPPASITVEVTGASPGGLTRFARTVAGGQVVPTALELTWPPPRALVRFESVAQAVEQQAEETCEIARAHGASARMLDLEAEATCWREHAAQPATDDATIVSLGLPGSEIGRELDWLGRTADERGLEVTVAGRLALGSVRAVLRGPVDAQAATLEELRARRRDTGGHVVLLRGSDELRRRVEPWGPLGDAARIMQKVKARFDPNGVLNPGRWPFEQEQQA